ncbi:MAG: hypothetical protein WBG34_14325 [Flavobacteriales bacterium]
MDQLRFPLYRRSANGLNWYRINSPSELVEVQRVGRKHVIHRLSALAYPEHVRIQELIAMSDGHVEECPAEVVEKLLGQQHEEGR